MPKAKAKVEKKESALVRTPVVAVMGHVDHGKTSFLDAIRGTRVAAKEAGGITQNTRAHEVVTKSGFRITFIDTPGHEAFSKMRERGARVTDFVLLIVAADDGVQPQTKESIEFAKKDKVPVIVAINKIDIKGVNLKKIKSELSSYGVAIEEYGGDTLAFEISAKEQTGLEELLSGIELLAEVNGLKLRTPRTNSIADAFVLESNQDKQVGNVALCILKAGNLTEKFFGVTKDQIFKVRSYLDHNQKPINSVVESQPFWISGLKNTLPAGDMVHFSETEEKAKELQKELLAEVIKPVAALPVEFDPESLFAQMLTKREEIQSGKDQKELNVIVRTSTEGTLEAVKAKLEEMSTDESKVRVLSSGTGNVTEDDLNRAKLAKGIIVTFQLPTPSNIEAAAKKDKVLVRNYEVIYELFDEVQQVLVSLEEPITEDVEIARAKIKQVFILTNGDLVAGSEVVKGLVLKGYRIWVERQGVEYARGKITSLRVQKNEVKEVKKGLDCGIVIEPKVEGLQEGDEIVAYKTESY
jgi:translation initiation factor IF-2